MFNFLFYDYESFGIHPALDKPAQFACVRTDIDFNIVEKSRYFFCYPPNDYLPEPDSILITGITPQYTRKHGINEFFFSRKIFSILNKKNTCILGYNNLNFDDEITRNIFYRNFLDPYSWSWKNNNSRWDVLSLVRACFVLSPRNISWPKNKYGGISFKLQDLTKVNNISHKAHDALSDVYATIDLIKLIKIKKIELFNFFFKYRLKKNIIKLITSQYGTPLIYISNIFGISRNYFTCITPIFWSDLNSNMLIFFDLYMDYQRLLDFLKKKHVQDIQVSHLFKLGVNFLYVNKCPILVPYDYFSTLKFLKCGIDINVYLKQSRKIHLNNKIVSKIKMIFSNYIYQYQKDNVDLKIYDNFFSTHDKNQMKKIHFMDVKDTKNIKFTFKDKKLNEMLLRIYARNFSYLLNNDEFNYWMQYRCRIFNKKCLLEYFKKIDQLILLHYDNFKYLKLLILLKRYVFSLLI
ncbi:exodeoxyribonuclease I [Buchnera aphidicola]|uniref:exodeoxyribonuclease I n=1 Tax=Buchnera aphidicola TaxID=9 RepID=UPI0031B8482F